MVVQWIVHLPGVVIEEATDIQVGVGRLGLMPFKEWVKIDDSFSTNDRDYDKSRPVFYIGESDLPDDMDSAINKVSEWVYLIYLAFLLDAQTPLLPPPQMSVTYLKVKVSVGTDEQTLVTRVIGPFDREWLVFGSRIKYSFNNKSIAAIHQIHNILVSYDPSNAFTGIEAGLSTLAMTARPEFWWLSHGVNRINDFVHCMTSIEYILLPGKNKMPKKLSLTQAFGRNAAVFVSQSRDDLHERSKFYSGLYRLRSRLIHGEIGISDLNDNEWGQLEFGRRLLRSVILQAIMLKRKVDDEKSLPLLLSEAYENVNAHDDIFKLIAEAHK